MGTAEQQKVVFITGGASGIGLAAAEAFVQRGYATVLADRNAEAGRDVEAELGTRGECTFVPCDVADDKSVRGAVARAVRTYGRLDAAFNAAGIDGDYGPLADASMENWNRVIAVDLTGTFSCMRHEIPELVRAGGGAIVNCASVAGLRAAPTVSAYTAAKHGVVGLTKAGAREYAALGVRVNAICPGTVDTPMFRHSLGSMAERLAKTNPTQRLADASEIAAVAVWLCDEAPGYLTGETIAVDGAAGA